MESRLQQHDSHFDEFFGAVKTEEPDQSLAHSRLLEDHSTSPEKFIDLDFKHRTPVEIKWYLNSTG